MPILETWSDLQRELDAASQWDWRTQVRERMIWYRMTEREQEIVWLLFQGMTNKEIAYELFMAINTVKFHLANVFVKLEVTSRELVILKLLAIR